MKTFEELAYRQLSRRTLLRGAGLGVAGFTLAQQEFVRSVAAQDDDLQNILDIVCTTERFGVTFLGEGLRANEAGQFDRPWPDVVVAVVEAARAQEQYHLRTFERLGGNALKRKFTVPPETLTSFAAFFGALVEQETAETASQIAAIGAFTDLGRPDLVKVAYQYGAEESEHRLLANYTLGNRPANDNAFAPALFNTVAEFYESLQQRGIINGPGTEITYPGPGDIQEDNVINKSPDGPVASCAAGAATPTAGGTPLAAGATPIGGEQDDESATPEA